MPITSEHDVKTLGELRVLTNHLPDDTPLCIDRGFDGTSETIHITVSTEHNAGDRILELS